MSTVILRGEEAVHYAEVHGLRVNRGHREDGSASTTLTVKQAAKLVEEHGDELWVETRVAVNPGEHMPQSS